MLCRFKYDVPWEASDEPFTLTESGTMLVDRYRTNCNLQPNEAYIACSAVHIQPLVTHGSHGVYVCV